MHRQLKNILDYDMISKTPEMLIEKITEAMRTRNPQVIKDFLEEFTFEVIESQKPAYEQLLIGAAEQGIITERERCINLIVENCPAGDIRTKLVALIRGETAVPSSNETPV